MAGKTPEYTRRAIDAYNERAKANGRRRLPGSWMPEDVRDILERRCEAEGIGLAEAIWRCVRDSAE